MSNDILGKIEAAEADHRECREGGCKCYEAVIDSDLAKFPKVTRKMLADIRNAVKHSVVYQIIVGRVYRSPEKCLFPLRCRGVEHFLLELAPKFKRDTEFAVNFHDWPHIREVFNSPVSHLNLRFSVEICHNSVKRCTLSSQFASQASILRCSKWVSNGE